MAEGDLFFLSKVWDKCEKTLEAARDNCEVAWDQCEKTLAVVKEKCINCCEDSCKTIGFKDRQKWSS